MNKSLSFRRSPLSSPERQRELLQHHAAYPPFASTLAAAGIALRASEIQTLQVNVGKMCNQVCAHCHVDAGPDRKEIMTRETMEACLAMLRQHPVKTVDLTGGAPEMNPHFRWFVESLRHLEKDVMVRSNLTIIVANKKYNDLPAFFRRHHVEVTSSLPFYSADRTDRQRGQGVFADSITALQMLNEEGYGQPGSGLVLNLVYNPSGAFLPPLQAQLERDFKTALSSQYGIEFNRLYCITNMPISRYLEYLLNSGNYERYMERLVSAFNPAATKNLMCRSTLSVGWDGSLYDCDFNQMLDMKVNGGVTHIEDFDASQIVDREVRVNQHCYGCTAGSGSSCGGSTT